MAQPGTPKLDAAACVAIFVAALGLSQVEPAHYEIRDTARLEYPKMAAQVPTWLLFVLVASPFLLALLLLLRQRLAGGGGAPEARKRLVLLLRALGTSVSVCFFVTEVAKKMVGRPRPNFVALCGWNGSECTAETEDAMSAYQSFPSGHTSTMFSAHLPLTFYFLSRARRGSMVAALPSLLPVLLASWVGITRIQDYWHNWDDVLAGACIGSLCAAFGRATVAGTGAGGGGDSAGSSPFRSVGGAVGARRPGAQYEALDQVA